MRHAIIVAYTGSEGTVSGTPISYPANEMPQNSFCDGIFFSGKKALSSIILPTSLIGIGKSAFADCGLIRIDIPENVTTIGEYAFYDCEKLTSVDIPDGLVSIGMGAFRACEELTSINLPNNLISTQIFM